MEQAYRNALVVTADESFLGSVLVRDGKIAAVDRGPGGQGRPAVAALDLTSRRGRGGPEGALPSR